MKVSFIKHKGILQCNIALSNYENTALIANISGKDPAQLQIEWKLQLRIFAYASIEVVCIFMIWLMVMVLKLAKPIIIIFVFSSMRQI